ncbi:MAG: zinc-dependent metalloprotease, partial [Bacteroidetes bacterium]|nr:zinc-dependent metalloprotease [Bacteroidota bacterium]
INGWILEKADKREFQFGRQQGDPIDPTAQTEDLGDDAMRASDLGIENLKRISLKLLDWGTEKSKDYSDLEELYGQVTGQFNRYLGHVLANIGGIEGTSKTTDQPGVVYQNTAKEKQARAVDFLNRQLFTTPTWLIDAEILQRIEASGNVKRIGALQDRNLARVLSGDRLLRMIDNEAINSTEAYTVSELMKDLEKGIWTELKSGKEIDIYRRNLQKAYISRLGELLESKNGNVGNSDIPSITRSSLVNLQSSIKAGLGRQSGVSKDHLTDVLKRIDEILDPK